MKQYERVSTLADVEDGKGVRKVLPSGIIRHCSVVPLASGLAVFLLLWILTGVVSVPAGEMAVVDFFGFVPEATIPSGIHTRMMFSSVHRFSLKTQLMELTLNVPTNEGLVVELDVSVLYRIVPSMVRQLYMTVGNNFQQVVLLPEVTSTVRSLTASVSSKALYTASRDELSAGIATQLNKRLGPRGIEVEQALLRKVVLPSLVTAAIEQKLKAEQDSQRMEFVLQKERQEAERKRIEAKGVADFQGIVSQGISERLLEWKGIEATERLANSNNAKIVIVGNSRNGLPLVLGDGSLKADSSTDSHESKGKTGNPT